MQSTNAHNYKSIWSRSPPPLGVVRFMAVPRRELRMTLCQRFGPGRSEDRKCFPTRETSVLPSTTEGRGPARSGFGERFRNHHRCLLNRQLYDKRKARLTLEHTSIPALPNGKSLRQRGRPVCCVKRFW